MASEFTRAARLDELPHGAKQVVEINGKPVLLCNWNGKIFAVSNICSHAEEKLECGRLGNGWIACPIHGARFELATGKAKNPPAKQPIPVYEVRENEGWIEVAA
jgi:3-phenylpropionate/trans-cinnamate dioxygenase ferredoxin component